MDKQPPPRGFDTAEFARRAARAQRLMAAHQLDGVVLTTPQNIRWATGFDSQFWESPTRPWFVVLPAMGEPIAIVPEIGAAEFERTWLSDVRAWPSPRPADDGTSLLAAALLDLPRRHGRVGFELGAEQSLRMPVTQFLALQGRTPGVDLVDGSACLWALRMVKTEAEIAHLAWICDLASDVYERAPTLLNETMTERDAARALRIALAEAGADATPFLPVIAGPGGPSQIICGPSDRRFQPGDLAFVDTGSVYDGYYCDFDRLYAVGEISDAAKRAYDLVWRATEAGIAAARPGVTAQALHRAMAAVIEEAGPIGAGAGRFGHGVGLQLTEPPSHMPGDQTVICEGMVLTIEPGVEYAPGRLIVQEENLVIRADGPELLTRRAPTEAPRLRS